MVTIFHRHLKNNDYPDTQETLYSPPQAVGLELGYMMMLVSFLGIFFPYFMGLNLSVMHCLVLGGSGALSVYGSLVKSNRLSYRINLLLGFFFLANAVIGYLVGEPGAPRFQFYTPEQLEHMAPGFLELATTDHIVHGLISMFFFFEAYSWRHHYIHGKSYINKKYLKTGIRILAFILLISIILTVTGYIRGFP